MRTPFVVGNWKLHKTIAEAQALASELKNQLASQRHVHVGIAPVATALHAVAKRLDDSALIVVAQDCFWEASGAWTGAISAPLLVDAGARWIILGHSERRTHFGDTDATIAKKCHAAWASGAGVILCIGETEAERDAQRTMPVLETQLAGALAGVSAIDAATLVIAYEPVWAIGTGKTATPAQAQEVHASIRAWLRTRFGAVADEIRLQYGGSVKASNAEALLSMPDIDGALVGGAALQVAEFVAIVKAARG